MVQAQTTVLFSEDFDSGPPQVTTGSTGGVPPIKQWTDTTGIYTTATKAYYVSGTQTQTNVYFETNSFSTVGNPFVRFEFNHIAKLFSANQAFLQISTDNGATWTFISASNSLYLGGDPSYPSLGYFNQGSHQTTTSSPWVANDPFAAPDSTWYIKEIFDLTGLASDTSGGLGNFVGYPNVKLRFYATFNFEIPPQQGFAAGWFVDDIEVVGAPCELSPPQVTFNYNPLPCYANNPIGGLVADPSNSYPVGVLATDTASPFDSGIDSVICVYRINNGVWDSVVMPPFVAGVPDEHKGFIPNVMLYDTVDYYVVAWDLGCPNNTRKPEIFVNNGFYTFWIDSAPPVKCGTPFCNQYPFIILVTDSTDWVENFEAGEWQVGSGDGNATTNPTHRGTFPDYIPYRWTVSPNNTNPYGWSIRSGQTGTLYTGPLGDHTTGNGKYIYLESSHIPPGSPLQSISSFTTPCIDLTRVTGCYALEFYYHMFGQQSDLLAINVDTGSNGASFMTPIYYIQKGEVQKSSSDPWERGIISLEPFVGSIIRLQFLGRNRFYNGANTQNDISIDDLRIFEPDPVEMEVLGTTEPVNGYCNYTSNEPVTISLRNNGCATAVDIPIAFQVNNNPIQRDTILGINLKLAGDTLEHVFNPGADLSAFGTYQIKVWSEMPGDVDNSNDTAVGPIIHHDPAINTFPYIEDFENAVPGGQVLNNPDFIFTDGLNPNFLWQVGTEMTTTPNTGPYKGMYWEGNYLYAQSNASSGSVSTYMRTLCVDLTGMTNPTLYFHYHDYAGDFQNLEIELSKGDESAETWNPIGGSIVTASSNFELDDWKYKRVSLNAYAGQFVKLRFKATRKVGAGDETNFAIDNITILDGIAKDAGAMSLSFPARTGVFNLSLVPKVKVANYGTTNLTNYTVHLEIQPLCGTNPPVTFSQTFTNNIAPGNTFEVTMNQANVAWPPGENKVLIYTTTTGDTHNFNDTISRNIIGIGSFDIPYAQNFDSCNYSGDGFYPAGGTGFLQWERGTPSFGFGPHSAPNTWATNLDGPFIPGTTENLVVPNLDNFDTIARAEFRFWQNHNFGGGSSGDYNAAGTVEYFDGTKYVPMGGDRVGLGGGSTQIGINWFDGIYGDLNVNLFNNDPGWVGSTGGQYKFTMYPLNEFNQQPHQLISRFKFKSKVGGTPAVGWAIDDYEMYVPPQNSVAPHSVNTINPLPFPYVDQYLSVVVLNSGAKTLKSFDVAVWIDGTFIGKMTQVQVKTDPTKPIIRGRTWRLDSFAIPWPAAQVTPGVHTVCIKTDRPNNKRDNYPIDDSTCFTIKVLREIDMTATGDTSFCDGFEQPISEWISLNSLDLFDFTSSWEQGSPSQIDTGAYEGNKVWMTRLDSNYGSLDASGLYSPLFLVDSGLNYEMNFWHWFRTEKYHDGGNVEYTFDNGNTWQPFGFAVPGKDNWYNTPFVTSLDIIRSGWTDTSDNWINANQVLTFLDDVKVVFRFRFGADYSLENAGWAIDDFCFKQTTDKAQAIISEEEFIYDIPQQVVIGELSPNPSQSWAELAFRLPSRKDVNVTVYNIVGQLIESRSEDFSEGVHQMKFNTSDWNNGVYLVNFEIDGVLTTKKLIVSH